MSLRLVDEVRLFIQVREGGDAILVLAYWRVVDLGKRFTFHGRRNVRAVPLDNDAHDIRQL